MIRNHNLDRASPLHSNAGVIVNMPTTDTDEYVAAVAMSAVTAGQALTLVSRYCPGWPTALVLTTGVGNVTANFTVTYEDQFGRQHRETFDFAASSTAQKTAYACRKVISIVVNSRTSNSSTIEAGYTNASGTVVALPFEVLTPTTGFSATEFPTSEFVYLATAAGVKTSISALDTQRATITLAGSCSGTATMMFEIPPGLRP